MRRPGILAATILAVAATASAEVRSGTFRSAALGRDVAYVVDLPPSYDKGASTYPVVIALHGLFESSAFWERRGLAPILADLRSRGEVPEFLLVAVDGGNSFFVNGPDGRYQDLVTQDVLAHVAATYRVKPGRDGQALLGISMGGYAALRIAFQQPQVFGAVATHSAMLLEKAPSPEDGAGRWHMAAFQKVFGEPIDTARWSAADPLLAARNADPKAAPALYFDCGQTDRFGLFVGNEDLHRTLAERSVAHTFSLEPGDHGYEFVRSVLPRSLKFLGAALTLAGKETK
ncbi:MAG TPA: alpha/beta fold hydrolase [Vicinamibacteria bacterium]